MTHDRRRFIGSLAAGAAAAMVPFPHGAADALAAPRPGPGEWDLSWVERIKGKHRAVFDSPEVECGYAVWRATLWEKQYMDVLGAKPEELSAVLVLRHNGITLAMQQPFWDEHRLGAKYEVRHPLTLKPTDRNPALLSSKRGEVPADFDELALDRFLARGGIVLACDLALQDMVDLVAKKHGVSPEEARKQALAALVPGVVLQPSGVFAALHAQDAGCHYLMAS